MRTFCLLTLLGSALWLGTFPATPLPAEPSAIASDPAAAWRSSIAQMLQPPPVPEQPWPKDPVETRSRESCTIRVLDGQRNPTPGTAFLAAHDQHHRRVFQTIRFGPAGFKASKDQVEIIWGTTVDGGLFIVSFLDAIPDTFYIVAAPPGVGECEARLLDLAFLHSLPTSLRVEVFFLPPLTLAGEPIPGRAFLRSPWMQDYFPAEYLALWELPWTLDVPIPAETPVPVVVLTEAGRGGSERNPFYELCWWDAWYHWDSILTNTERTLVFDGCYEDPDYATYRDFFGGVPQETRYEDDACEVILEFRDDAGTPLRHWIVDGDIDWLLTDADGRLVYHTGNWNDDGEVPGATLDLEIARWIPETDEEYTRVLDTEVMIPWPIKPGTVVPVVMTRTASVSLSLLAPDGWAVATPAAGIEVVGDPTRTWILTEETEPGTCLMRGLPPGWVKVRVRTAAWGDVSVPLHLRPGENPPVTIALPGATPQVEIQLEPRDQVAGTRYTLTSSEWDAGEYWFDGYADEEGRIRLAGLPAGNYRLRLLADTPETLDATGHIFAASEHWLTIREADAEQAAPRQMVIQRTPGAILTIEEGARDTYTRLNPGRHIVPAGPRTVWGLGGRNWYDHPYGRTEEDGLWYYRGTFPPFENAENPGLPLAVLDLQADTETWYTPPPLPLVRMRGKPGVTPWTRGTVVRVTREWTGGVDDLGARHQDGPFELFLSPDNLENTHLAVTFPPGRWDWTWRDETGAERHLTFETPGDCYYSDQLRAWVLELETPRE